MRQRKSIYGQRMFLDIYQRPRYSVRKGGWTSEKFLGSRAGILMFMERTTYLSIRSSFRRYCWLTHGENQKGCLTGCAGGNFWGGSLQQRLLWNQPALENKVLRYRRMQKYNRSVRLSHRQYRNSIASIFTFLISKGSQAAWYYTSMNPARGCRKASSVGYIYPFLKN